jgi:hypothetical protein
VCPTPEEASGTSSNLASVHPVGAAAKVES